MKEQIKELRVQIDGLAQLTKELKPVDALFGTKENAPDNAAFKHIMINSKEIDKTVDSLYLAKAWLGKVLGELGESTPYANDGNRKTVEDIEPAADRPGVNNEVFTVWLHKDFMQNEWYSKNHIEKVDWLRCSIENLIQEIIKIDLKGSREFAIARTNTYNHLCEARFWLGFELGRVRDDGK